MCSGLVDYISHRVSFGAMKVRSKNEFAESKMAMFFAEDLIKKKKRGFLYVLGICLFLNRKLQKNSR